MATNWQELANTSHYQTALAVKDKLANEEITEASAGLEELIEALSRSDQRALRSQLLRLMTHIIKWKTQTDRRSKGWAVSIESARIEIEDVIHLEPSLKPKVPSLLVELFDKAKRLAEKEMGQKTDLTELTWAEVFDDECEWPPAVQSEENGSPSTE
jgi:leucyl aminopeptidase (aminopeptidase T)